MIMRSLASTAAPTRQREALGAFGAVALHAAATHQHRVAPLDAGTKALALIGRWTRLQPFPLSLEPLVILG